MSKIGNIMELLEGAHVMGDRWADYHAAKAVRDACRIKDYARRFIAMRHVLKNYRVTVSLESDERVRICRNDIGKEITL